MPHIHPPCDDLIRAVFNPTPTLRSADDGSSPTLYGHFAVFNQWTEIDSFWEGQFLERLAPGAFKKTMRENGDQVKVLYDHGYDPQLGNKPLGPIQTMNEDNTGAYYEVPLIDTNYNRDFVIPAAEAGLLGASFRFKVTRDEWVDEPKVSMQNPKGIPERTIKEVRLYEFGPVTFPAYAAASAGIRSRVGYDLWRGLSPDDRQDLARMITRARTEELRTSTTGDQADDLDPVEVDAASSTEDTPPTAEHLSRTSLSERRRRILELKGALSTDA